jgi:hypothetical protein
MEKTPKIAVFTRLHYEKDIPQSNLYCFENVFLKSLINQSYQDFELVIISNYNKSNNDKIRQIIKQSGFKNTVVFTTKENRLRYIHDIEVNCDSDDGLHPDFIKECVNHYHNFNPRINNFLVVFTKYEKTVINTGERYKCPLPTKENNGFPTNFYAVIQRGEKTLSCGMRSHNRMDTVIPNIVVNSELVNEFSIHNSNTGSKIYNSDVKI